MNLSINPSLLSSAVAVSASLHGVALIVLTNSLLFRQEPIKMILPPEKPAVTVIEVSLENLPPRLTDPKLNNNQAVKDQTSPERTLADSPISAKTEVPHKAITKAKANKPKQPHELSSAKLVKVKKPFKPEYTVQKMPDLLLSKASENSIPLHKSASLSDAPTQALIDKTPSSNTQAWKPKQSLSQNTIAAVKPSAINSKQALAAAKPSSNAGGVSSALPPLLKSRQPDYPDEARWEERTGKATLKFKITNEGRVTEPQVVRSSGHRDLDMAAVRALQFWRFKALESHAYNQWYQYSFRFELN